MTDRQPLSRDMFDELCPSSLLPFRFGGNKWAPLVMRCLEDGPRRYSELRVPLHRVTPKVLTQALRGLERDGLISRAEYPGPVLRVEYALTPLGRSMLEPLYAACAWATDHWDELLDAREQNTAPAGGQRGRRGHRENDSTMSDAGKRAVAEQPSSIR